MRFTVDLDKCQDHAQCVFAAPEVFSMDDAGRLSLRACAEHEYVSADLPEANREPVEEAADMCPVQAIAVDD